MNGVSKLSVTDDVALVTFHGIAEGLGFISSVFSDFAKANINIDMISQSAPMGDRINISFTVAGKDLISALSIISQYKDSHPDLKPLVSSGNSKIQLFGEEMRDQEGVAANAISSVAYAGAQVLMITTSEVDISLLLPSCHLEEALAALEHTFSVTPGIA